MTNEIDWADVDPQCITLIQAINEIEGLFTICSCNGHEKAPFRIWFMAETLEVLPDLLYWFDSCHCGFSGWSVTVGTDCAKSPVAFMIEGPIGRQAYIEAMKIASLIHQDQLEMLTAE